MTKQKTNNLFVKGRRVAVIALLAAMPLSKFDCFAQVPLGSMYIPKSSSRPMKLIEKKETKKEQEKTKTCNMDTCVASSDQTEYVANDTLQSHITQRKHDYSGIKESLLESFIMYFSVLAGISLIRLCDRKITLR